MIYCLLLEHLMSYSLLIWTFDVLQHAHDPREKEDDERETAEQEQRYKDILRENESLQKRIAEVRNLSEMTSCKFRQFWTPLPPLSCTYTLGLMSWGPSYKTFYTSGQCKIKCLNCRFNEKEKCNSTHMLGCSVLTLWQTKVCSMALFTCFRVRLEICPKL